ncbi:cytochrome C oxidase subunit IV family protein [Paenibacillus sp. YN15]|uniref:cytochrome C oxidase subunit IV family protein n=1 Tax=Paenibacillus sp. YN15 TaxID=1742774 RepID=UPI000DCE8AEB|nr:cytochrome C oxidase subunit IV family protein [Paenibacillus sp. YN15]RAU92006.1 hypothetical protein DQG13_28360 [Paenibacillus sp. YN15]
MSWEYNHRVEAAGSAVPAQAAAAAAAGEQAVEREAAPAREAELPLVSVHPAVRRRESVSRIHLFAFAASVLLTLLAFGAAIYGEMPADLLVPFLMLMAVIQLVIQLIDWMRLKNGGGLYSILSLIFGGVITLAAIGAAIYWVWI